MVEITPPFLQTFASFNIWNTLWWGKHLEISENAQMVFPDLTNIVNLGLPGFFKEDTFDENGGEVTLLINFRDIFWLFERRRGLLTGLTKNHQLFIEYSQHLLLQHIIFELARKLNAPFFKACIHCLVTLARETLSKKTYFNLVPQKNEANCHDFAHASEYRALWRENEP